MKKIFTFFLALAASVGMSWAVEGALSGAFTINAGGDKIVFSKGNLQATTSDLGANWTWGFAANQWEHIGDVAANNAIDGDKTVSANGSVDLFGWSTAATYYGIHNSMDNSTYSGDFVDWGATMGEGWFTLSKDEWVYLFFTRTDASMKFGKATVAGRHGVIILPDVYEGTAISTKHDAWDNNTISAEAWGAYEAAGAVFLPAAGFRGTVINGVGEFAQYWSSTPFDENQAYYIGFYETGLDQFNDSRRYGNSVRLVTAAPKDATTIDQLIVPNGKEMTHKVLRNGQILILRGEKTYTLQGQEAK